MAQGNDGRELGLVVDWLLLGGGILVGGQTEICRGELGLGTSEQLQYFTRGIRCKTTIAFTRASRSRLTSLSLWRTRDRNTTPNPSLPYQPSTRPCPSFAITLRHVPGLASLEDGPALCSRSGQPGGWRRVVAGESWGWWWIVGGCDFG
jgi:hypothetical protein